MTDETLSVEGLRPWPNTVVPSEEGLTRKFIAHYRRAFDADPSATFCAGEIDGITIVIANGKVGERLQEFVENKLDGIIQRPSRGSRRPG